MLESSFSAFRRSRRRVLSRSLLLAVVVLTGPTIMGLGATEITVTTADDELNADGDCSLREAITAANTNAVVDACSAGTSSPTDIINLPAGTLRFTISGDDNDCAVGDLDILEDLVINGHPSG